MRTVLMVLLGCATAAAGGCKSADPHAASAGAPAAAQSPTPAAPPSPPPVTLKSKIDPCKLLTSDELKTAQGEALQTTVPSEREYLEYLIAQCYYELPAITNSVVVNVTTAKERGKSVKEFWRLTHADNKPARAAGEPRTEDKYRAPNKIPGVGEEAYWEGSESAGALYVLKGNVIFRISVGGGSGSQSKLEKSKELARKALARI